MRAVDRAKPNRRRKVRPVPDIPDPSDEQISDLMKECGIGKAQKKNLKNELMVLRDEYLLELKRRGFYATSKQIVDGLTDIKNCAHELLKALREQEAFNYVLLTEYVRTAGRDTSTSEACVAKYEDDIEAIGRLQNRAKAALESHRRGDKHDQNRFAKASAKKPELSLLSDQVLTFWIEDLGRNDTGKDSPTLMKFAWSVFEYIVGPEYPYQAVVRQIQNAIERRQRREQAFEGVNEK